MAFKKNISITAISLLCFMFFNTQKANAQMIRIGNDIFFDKEINLYINNQEIIDLPMKPVFYNDHLLVPSREVFEPLGAYVTYIAEERTVYIIYNSQIIAIQIDNNTALINNKPVVMDVAPKIINNKLLIPLRSVSENLGLSVIWDSEKNSAYVNQSLAQVPPDTENNIDNPQTDHWVSENTIINNIINNKLPEINNINNINKNMITDLIIPNSGEKQKFILKFNNDINKFEKNLLSDNRLILDFDDVGSSLSHDFYEINKKEVLSIRIGKEENNTKTRVVFDLNTSDNISIIQSKDKKSILIEFKEESSENKNIITNNEKISYQNGILKISKDNLDIKDIIEFDDYNHLRYIISLPFSINATAINKALKSADDKVSSISIDVVNNNTLIVINEKKILAPVITQDQNYFYITMNLPTEVYHKIIVIDAGHGAHDPGTVNNSYFKDKTILEKELALSISKKLQRLIEKDNLFKVYMTRSDDEFLELKDRTSFSNNIGDLFVSIHINSATSSAANGIETFYYDNQTATSKGIESKKVADILQKHLLLYTNAKDRGVKTEPFFVIKNNNFPAVLVESGFISNESELAKLIDDNYQELIAEALYTGLKEVFSIYTPKR